MLFRLTLLICSDRLLNTREIKMRDPINIREAAELLGLSVPTMRRMIEEREVKHYRIGKRIKLERQDILDHIEIVLPKGEPDANPFTGTID